MTEETKVEDVNTGDDDGGGDRVTADHDAGLGSSADDLETHNPDMDDFDKALASVDADDDDAVDASGGTKNADDAAGDDDDTGDAGKGDDDDDKADIPRSRLNEVIAQRDKKDELITDLKVEMARDKAVFEGRIAALEKPEVTEKVVSPLDKILALEPQAILDAFQENPAEFIGLIKSQAKTEGAAEVGLQREEEKYREEMTSNLDKFAGDHDDFMPNADKLVGIMDGNPIHNIISAYAYEIEIPALTAKLEEATKGVDEKIAAAKAEGIVEGKKKAVEEFQAKGGAATLDGSQANQSGGGGQANTGIDAGGDMVKLKAKITQDLLNKRAATGG